jgi:hypothetical protein
LPFALIEGFGTDVDPFNFELPLTRGFFEVEVSDCALGAASFMTIFAWISSSFEALTFFGQKRVTNLEVKGEKYSHGQS